MASLIIRKMQIKTPLRFYLTPVKMATIKKYGNKHWREHLDEPLFTARYKFTWPLWKSVWTFIKTIKIQVPYDPFIPLLDIYPENSVPYHRDICPPTHVYCCSQYSKEREPTQVEWKMKIWYIHKMKYYSALNKNEATTFSGDWMDVQCIIPSKST